MIHWGLQTVNTYPFRNFLLLIYEEFAYKYMACHLYTEENYFESRTQA